MVQLIMEIMLVKVDFRSQNSRIILIVQLYLRLKNLTPQLPNTIRSLYKFEKENDEIKIID